ncbi:MAG: hypothetical protein ACKO92_04535, partial [Actinomycetota bacterium]
VTALPAVVLVALTLVLVAPLVLLVVSVPGSVEVVATPAVSLVMSSVESPAIVVATSSEESAGSTDSIDKVDIVDIVDKLAVVSEQATINIVAMIAMRNFTSRILTTEHRLVD